MKKNNFADELEYLEKCIDEPGICSDREYLEFSDFTKILKLLVTAGVFAVLPSGIIGVLLGLTRESSAQVYCAFVLLQGCLFISHRISEQSTQRLLLTRELRRLRSEMAKAK